MRQTGVLFTTIVVFLALSSCTHKSAVEPSEKRHATVQMKDGTKVTGTVVASSPSEITLAGDDSISRTIPMQQVRSVEYGDEVVEPPKTFAQREPEAAAPPEQAGARAPDQDLRTTRWN